VDQISGLGPANTKVFPYQVNPNYHPMPGVERNNSIQNKKAVTAFSVRG